MTRRIAVLTAGVVLLVLFGLLGTTLPVPYVAQVPGPTFNTLGDIDGSPIITVEGRDPNKVSGNLNLTTVGVSRGGLSLVQAVRGWFDDEVAVVPEESVYPPGRSEEETRQANREAFLTSEQAAESAALGHLGYPVKVVVQERAEGLAVGVRAGRGRHHRRGRRPADARLRHARRRSSPASPAGRRSRSTPPASARRASVADHHEGGDGPGRARCSGVSVLEQPSAPFDVTIDVKDVGGPSAGLMLTLGILDLVGDEDLTDGDVVAGTGTIDAKGTVGPIGGITLKMAAAQDIGAKLFLVPADNCAEATGVADPGFPLAKVATLDDALKALSDFEAGRTPADLLTRAAPAVAAGPRWGKLSGNPALPGALS